MMKLRLWARLGRGWNLRHKCRRLLLLWGVLEDGNGMLAAAFKQGWAKRRRAGGDGG